MDWQQKSLYSTFRDTFLSFNILIDCYADKKCTREKGNERDEF